MSTDTKSSTDTNKNKQINAYNLIIISPYQSTAGHRGCNEVSANIEISDNV